MSANLINVSTFKTLRIYVLWWIKIRARNVCIHDIIIQFMKYKTKNNKKKKIPRFSKYANFDIFFFFLSTSNAVNQFFPCRPLQIAVVRYARSIAYYTRMLYTGSIYLRRGRMTAHCGNIIFWMYYNNNNKIYYKTYAHAYA